MVDEIKKLLGSEKLIIGTDRVMKNLRANKLEKIFISSNCDKGTLDDIKHYTEITETKVEELNMPNDELGVICKKPFSVSVIGILK